MRVATWNCQTGLSTNWDTIDRLGADLVAIQECREGTLEEAERHGWGCEFQPGGYGKGIATLIRAPYVVEEREPTETFAISTIVSSGDERIRFVNFWAMTPKLTGYTYTRQATRLIERLPSDGLATIVAGDFNASKSRPHLDNVRRLNERGLVSAYHRRTGREHAELEDDPTSYHLWREERPFHMDFVFVPEDWRIDGVDVGSYEDYCLTKLSDHMPVVVTLEAVPSNARVSALGRGD